MNYNFPQIIFLISSLLAALGLIFIIYSRSTVDKTTKLFILVLIISIAYLTSHSIHFLFMRNADVTVLDISCHSFLLLMIVTLTFFAWNFPTPKKMGIIQKLFIILPSLVLLVLLWSKRLIISSHVHINYYIAQYSKLYPLYLIWYIILVSINIFWLINKYNKEKDSQIQTQILLFLVGIVITNILLFIFGFFLPWIVGFYFLIEMSPLAFLVGVILFTAVAIGKYNMFPVALKKVRTFSINKKIFLSAIILVPIIILLIEIPLIRLIFRIRSSDELIRDFYVTLFGGVIVSVSMAFVLQKIISSPLIKLKSRALEIEKEHYGIKVDFNSNDEIGELTEAFNSMSETLNNNSIELQKRQERISLLLNAFDKSLAAIAIADKSFTIIEVNDSYCRLMGRKRESIVSKSIKEIQFINSLEKEFDKIKRKIEESNSYEGEIIWEINNDIKNLLISVTPASLDGISSKGFLFVEVDITDRKKLEAQLRKSEKLAALGEMAAILAHEIKTPLTSIKMNSDILVESLQLNDDDQFSFSIIQKEINRLNNLVKDVLQFSRQMEFTFSKFNLKHLIDEIKSQLFTKLEVRNIGLHNNINNIAVKADYEKLKQVFLNLIENAVESIDKDGTIELSSGYNKSENDFVILLKDNGPGIKNVDKIFEPFFTTKSSNF